MGPRPDALTAAIDEAWRVFDIPAPKDLGVCTGCCMDPALAAEMQATPARALTDQHILEWYGAAFDPAPLFVLSLIPYLAFLWWARQVRAFPRLALRGFELTLVFVAATITGFATVRWLLAYIANHRFTPFAWYRIGLGALLLLGLPAGG